jgi:hypothetical protein
VGVFLLLQNYCERYGKVVFTTTELAKLAGHSLPVLKVTLHCLSNSGVLQRYTVGRYGLPGATGIEDLAASVDTGG